MNACGARVAAQNEDGYLQCELDAGHLGPCWDTAYREAFTTAATDPH